MNRNISALIIEDESNASRRLQRLLSDIAPDMEVLAVLESVKDAVTWLRHHSADLIFLDIHLADGLSFAIFESVTVKSPIIFTTAYDEYAIKAFKLNSLDYLLKPIERDELRLAMRKFRDQATSLSQMDLSKIMNLLQQPQESYQERFMVSAGDKIRSIPIEQVSYFFGQQKFVFLITHDGRRHVVDYTLTQLEKILDPSKFFRINRQFIIGFDAIVHMYPHSKSRLRIELNPRADIDAVVSIEKTPRFKEWIGK